MTLMYEIGREPFESTLLTNFDKTLKPMYQKAIDNYKKDGGSLDIYIKEEAYWYTGFHDKKMNSLHSNDKGINHTRFWKYVDEIRGDYECDI